MKNNHARATRGEVGGWSSGATRRNTEFLYSIREDQLDGVGYAVTLTLRDCPPDASAWHRLRRAWEKRMLRAGMIRLHWVTEWQKRGCPHLHGAIWFPREVVEKYGHQWLRSAITSAWLLAGAMDYGAGHRGQDCHEITGAVGWFQYVSKHAARGVKHYQRSSENVPEAWKQKTGRMWGKVGDWPVQPPIRVNLQGGEGDGGFYAYRRMVRSWRVAGARADGDLRRLRLARSMLTCHEEPSSRVRGFSEWIPQEVSLSLLALLAARGYSIRYEEGTPDQVRELDRERERAEDDAWLDQHFTPREA
jgi:hypothetical protein